MQTDQEQRDYFHRSFTNLAPDADTIDNIETMRAGYKSIVDDIIAVVPAGRCRSLALTNLEASLMYAVKGLVGVDDRE